MNPLFDKPFTFDRVARILFGLAVIIGVIYLIAVLRNALLPFLILVSISAIGSVIIILFPLNYQLAFLTPGICPLFASSLKQIRQIPYFLK